MTKMLRVVRGVLGMATTWGVAWSMLAVSIRIVRHLSHPVEPTWRDLLVNSALPASQYGLVYGAAMGALVGVLIAATSVRVKSIQGLSMPRVGVLGAVVSLGAHFAVTGLTYSGLGLLLLSGTLGFGVSSGTVLVARRAKTLPAAHVFGELPSA
ncbi:hypothetical protein [Gemmatimonas sp.]|uniref:hypothetical protein n=1 Tax=Gemmatimonas sp. TaxID=1962908 RepID=UPI00333F8E1A